MRTKLPGPSPVNGSTANGNGGGGGGGAGEPEGGPENWEVRPCGMLVQKRLDADQIAKPPPTVRVRVKFGSIYHEININCQASFGELKKMLTGPTGLHHEDQKLFFKGKERDSKQFLDIVGVKDKSKLVLMEDPISQEKRYLELRKNARMEKAAKLISEISFEVDRLAGQVTALESVILKGGRVAEKQIADVIELLMNELVKLDGILADGDVKLQRKMQVKRVQKLVETLDSLKVKNSMPSANGGHMPNQNEQKIPNEHIGNGQIPPQSQERASKWAKPPLAPKQQQRHSIGHSPLKPESQSQQPSRNSTTGTVVTTQWETFESAPPLIPVSSASPPRSATTNQVKSPWDIFQ